MVKSELWIFEHEMSDIYRCCVKTARKTISKRPQFIIRSVCNRIVRINSFSLVAAGRHGKISWTYLEGNNSYFLILIDHFHIKWVTNTVFKPWHWTQVACVLFTEAVTVNETNMTALKKVQCASARSFSLYFSPAWAGLIIRISGNSCVGVQDL